MSDRNAVVKTFTLSRKKRLANSRVFSIYFKTRRDIALARRAARLSGVPLAAFIRDAALARAERVVAA